MLKLEDGQLKAFRKAAVEHFEARMLLHIQEYFPQQVNELGEDTVRHWIQHGIQRAKLYDVQSSQGVCRYVSLMFFVGMNFDIDPRYSRCREVLSDKRASESRKLERLLNLVLEFDSRR